MGDRIYYAARKGMMNSVQMDFYTFKKVFLHIFDDLENNFYFRAATGYSCVNQGEIRGIWGSDIEAYILLELKMVDIWPIQEKIEWYDEPTLFTIIEFLYDFVSEPQTKIYHSLDNHKWDTWDYDKEIGREKYRKKINEILKEYDKGYQLSLDGEIIEITPEGFEELVKEIPQTDDPNNIDNRMKTSITKYFRYGSTIDEKKDAIRSLADVLEYLKKEGYVLLPKDDSDLFKIINRYDIRHHNRSQQSDYDVNIWYDWFFYNFLSSINVLLKLKEKSDGS